MVAQKDNLVRKDYPSDGLGVNTGRIAVEGSAGSNPDRLNQSDSRAKLAKSERVHNAHMSGTVQY